MGSTPKARSTISFVYLRDGHQKGTTREAIVSLWSTSKVLASVSQVSSSTASARSDLQLQNHLLIKHLIKSLPTHPLLIPIPPHTSQSVFHHRHLRPWSRPEVVSVMKRICTKWGFWEEGDAQTPSKGGVSMLSHSNGSVAHGWRESFSDH